MVALDEFSRAVAAVYASAADPERWPDAIREINYVVGGNGGALLSATDQVWCIDDGVLPPEAAISYAEHYCRLDHTLTPLRTGPVGLVRTADELIAPYRGTEFYNGWLHPNDIEDAMFVRITDGPMPTCFLIHSGRTRTPMHSSDTDRALAALVPHLQQALSMQRRMGALADKARDAATALDAIDHGVIIIGADSLVAEVNRAAKALVDSRDGISLRASCFRLDDASADRALQRSVMSALGTGGAVPTGNTLTVERPSGKRPLVIQVMPLYQPVSLDERSRPRALITITDPDRGRASPASSLLRHYSLTRAEAEVAERIGRGGSPRQIADELCVSVDTVRTHLRHVFQKTNTHRQAELVRLLVSMN